MQIMVTNGVNVSFHRLIKICDLNNGKSHYPSLILTQHEIILAVYMAIIVIPWIISLPQSTFDN